MEPAWVILMKLLAVVVLVFLNGFFVAAEFALVKVRDTQLRPLMDAGNRRAGFARIVLANLDASLSACQLGITLASLGLGWVGEPVFASILAPLMDWLEVDSEKLRHTISFIVGFTVITFLHITAGEQAPKLLAIQKPLPTSLWVARPLMWFHRVSYPFIWGLNTFSFWLLRKIGVQSVNEHEISHSDEELKLMIASGKDEPGSQFGRGIVLNAFDLSDRVAREVMCPRHEIVCLSTEDSIDRCLQVAEETRHSRFPLCLQGDLDRTVGVIHIKDLYARRRTVKGGEELRPFARKLIFVPETARLDRLLQFFLERKLHLAMVVDEYGSTVGMVTLENVLEELVGQIQDEFDHEQPLYAKISDMEWQLEGALPLHELSDITQQEISSEGLNTTSGWVTEQLGGFAKVGDVVPLEGFELRVEKMAGLKVAQLKLLRTPPPSEGSMEPVHQE